MMLDDLYELVEALRERIDAHESELQKSEALTRYALIDPLLRGLGWDTGDPSQVLVEYRSKSGSADYALLDNSGQPRVVIEAKRLGTPLMNAVGQVINYCIHDGFEFFAVTDGAIWELYETNHPGPLHDRLLVRLNLNGSVAKTSRDALALWRRGVEQGVLAPGSASVFDDEAMDEPANTASGKVVVPSSKTNLSPVTLPSNGKDSGWHSLDDFSPTPGTKPTEIRLPNGHALSVASWSQMTKEIVLWLQDANLIDESLIPFYPGNSSAAMLNWSPDTPDGKSFATWSQVGGLYVNHNYNAGQHVRNCRALLAEVGQLSAMFGLRVQ